MPEPGGTTTQSGILFQNSFAALYLGRLCDVRRRPSRERVIEVRIEAPEHVDDTVITYADRHREWIQAKESVAYSGESWTKIWQGFENQRWSHYFSSDDRLALIVGSNVARHQTLREMCLRANDAMNYREWQNGITAEMRSLLEDIRSLLGAEYQSDESVFALFSHVEVQIVTLDQIERDEVPRWIPPSSTEPTTLFRLLRDRCGGHARYRRIFRAPRLLAELEDDDNVSILEPEDSGAPAYRSAVSHAYSRIEVPGTAVSGGIADLFFWPTLQEMQLDQLRSAGLEDEDPRYQRIEIRGSIDLRYFPNQLLNRAVVVAGAGFGKTALLTAVAHRLSETLWLPVFVPLSELAESRETVVGFLRDQINDRFNVAVRWDHYCELGRAVVLFDGLDELTPTHRRRMLDSIREFSSRYPEVPWLLTVRDAKALAAPVDAKTMKIDVFDDGQIRAFAEAYESAGSTVDADELLSQLRAYPDLRLLARIPLFLALLLATAEFSTPLPRKRSDLLEHYLHVVFRPNEYKSSPPSDDDPLELRGIAEHLAFAALEQGKIGFNEQEAVRMLRARNDESSPTRYIAALTAYGLLKRSANWLTFAFPIVQEYLAAGFLLPRASVEITQEFGSSARRPWAQMLQFVVERHHGADEIINNLLAAEDDAFSTVLRLIGQCVVNGARVSTSTKQRVGDKLAEMWLSPSYNIRENIGKLIADAFISPLPERVRNILEQGRGLYSNGGEIVVASNDPTLTNAVLKARLNNNLEHEYHLHDLQSAVDAIASEALQRYVERVKADHTTEKEVESLASLIAKLSRENLAPQAYRRIVDDSSLPSVVRLAGYLLGPQTLPEDALTLIEEVLRNPEDEVHRVMGWYLAIEALWRTGSPIRRWQVLVGDGSLPEKRRDEILFSLLASKLTSAVQIDVLRELRSSYPLTSNVDHSASLLLGNLGDSNALKSIDDQLHDLSIQNLGLWAITISKNRSSLEVSTALQRVNKLNLSAAQRAQIANSLAFGLRGDVRIEGQRAFSLRELTLHPAAPDCARMIFEWADECRRSTVEHLSLLSTSLSLGYQMAAGPLAGRLEHIVSSEPELLDSFEFDRTFADGISALGASENVSHTLPLSTLKLCIEVSTSNTALRAIDAIASLADGAALETLINLRNDVDTSMKGSLEDRIEELSGRLGSRVTRDSENFLQVRDG